MSVAGKFLLGSTRVLTAICGFFSITWAVSSLLVYHAEAAFTMYAKDVLQGDKFSAEQLNQLKSRLDATPLSTIRPSALGDVAVIRLRLVEESESGDAGHSAADLDHLQKAIVAALAGNPKNSFLWLADYRLQRLSNSDPGSALKFLRMSYLSGPNEGWIAVRRNPLALRVFPLLPDELAQRALVEFSDLVRSGFYWDAASILAGPGWAIHDRLLAQLLQIDAGNRGRFARVLDSKNLDGVTVPGLDERPSRPY